MTSMQPTSAEERAQLAGILADLVEARRGAVERQPWQRVILDPRLRADLDACLRALEILEVGDVLPPAPE
jgi:hypothetical protein